MDKLTKHMFHIKALQKQKRFMKRVLRKPHYLNTRDYITRVCKINDLLTQIPGVTEDSKLPDEKLLDLQDVDMPSS